jgi:membrane-bound lytic murein transglycosylase D
MRLRVLVGSLALPLMVVGQLGVLSAAATEPPSVSLSEDVVTPCGREGATEIVEPEVVGACSTAADLARIVPPVKQSEGVDSSTAVVAFEPGFLFPRIGVAAGPVVKEIAPPATFTLVVPPYKVEDNHDVRRFLDQFQTGYRRAVVERWLVRAGRYLPMVLDVFKQKGLPEELVFTAMIESGFDPLAASRAGAKGLWQFMAPTARRYGLRVDNWLDERLDPEKSTVAAARHFLDLYAVFGSWNLAQAAYNAGERTVVEAIKAMGTSDFWTLARGRWLADETKNFVPAIQAATIIAREPERYGFMVTPAPPLMYDVVSVPRSTSLKQLAAKAGLDPDALERLNPELRLKQTPPDASYPLKVPVGGTQPVRMALDRDSGTHHSMATSRGSSQGTVQAAKPTTHVVKKQETVGGIARRYGVTSADIIRWNGLDGSGRIRPGDRLRVASIDRRVEAQASTK